MESVLKGAKNFETFGKNVATALNHKFDKKFLQDIENILCKVF